MGSRARRRRSEQRPSTGPFEPDTWSLEIVGTTWEKRGPAYFWRRFWYALFLLFITAVAAAPGALALREAWKSSHGGFWVVLWLAVAAVLVGGALEWWRSAHRLQSDYTAADYRLAVPAGLVVWLCWLLLPVGGGILLALISSVLTGPMVAQFLRACFDRELWPEREWRMAGLSPAERRRAEKDKGWLPARMRGIDRLHQVKPDSQVHPHE